MKLGKRVRAKRRELKLSQDALARRADVSMSLINQMERGLIGDPHFSTLVRLAAALEISVGELVDEDLASPKGEAPSLLPEALEERREQEMMTQLAEELRERLIEELGEVPLEVLNSLYEALPSGIQRSAVRRARARVSARTGIWGEWEETEYSAKRRERREQDALFESGVDEAPGAQAG